MVQDIPKRIGLIGFGQIGRSLYEEITSDPSLGIEVVFIYDSNPEIAKKVPTKLALRSMENFVDYHPDLVVEAAHPEAVRQFYEQVLSHTDMMVMSVSAFGDSRLESSIKKLCQEKGTRLFIPHGAVLGIDGLQDGLSVWEQVTITMVKNPRNLNFDFAGGIKAEDIKQKTVLYDGPVRPILPLYPKNVNSHATLALATLGLDRTRSVLIADPDQEDSLIEIDASGAGNSIHIERRNPIKGVSGKLTLLSALETIKKILGGRQVIQVV